MHGKSSGTSESTVIFFREGKVPMSLTVSDTMLPQVERGFSPILAAAK